MDTHEHLTQAGRLEMLIDELAQAREILLPEGRPTVSLCYAQSLDGSIAALPARPTALSGPESSRLTHRLRAAHQAIVVGAGTVISDNPRLTVRLAPGEHPQPVILDSSLRVPLQAYLIKEHPKPAWIATTPAAGAERRRRFLETRVRLIDLPAAAGGGVDLTALLRRLGELGVKSLMVEGGARVISAFLQQKLVDRVILTIAPRWLSGLPAIAPGTLAEALHLEQPYWFQMGEDMLVWGRVA